MSELDLIIKKGIIIDGTGHQSFEGSIGIKDQIIIEIGKVNEDAKQIINANGNVVSPGFIDVHNHGDLSILHYPRSEGFLHQGITTFVGGNCGSSPGPYKDYVDQAWYLYDLYFELAVDMYTPERLQPLDKVNGLHKRMFGWEIDWSTLGEYCTKVQKKGFSPNYVPIVGHGDIRYTVMGLDYRRKATKNEIEKMKEQVHVAMNEGIKGLSVGRDYVPGYYADIEELVECAGVVSEYSGIYTSHSLRTGLRAARRPGEWPPGKINGIKEVIEVAEKAKVSVQVSHLSSLYDVWPPGDKNMSDCAIKATLAVIDEAIANGIDISFDLIPNHIAGGIYASTYVAGMLLPWLKVVGSRDRLAKALRMKQFRNDIRESIMQGKWYGLNPNINAFWATRHKIMECKIEEFRNKTISIVSKELEMDELEALFELIKADPDTKAMIVSDDDSSKLAFYKHQAAMIGIDTFSVDDKWESKYPPWFLPNENTFGGFPRYFRRAVRETNTLTLEEAIRKVTSFPAKKFNLKKRGTITVGHYADIVIFDPDTIADKGDAINPRIYPDGVKHVLVNGVLVIEEGIHTNKLPGKILYSDNSKK
ncbi:MAG: N-acyl-D-amino-acid deacylase family protein [Promethearchaeota archaeon]